MFLINWKPDATKEKSLKVVEVNFHKMYDTLKAMVDYHMFLKDEGFIESDFLYEILLENNKRGVYEKWVDDCTGIDDPLEYMEYIMEVTR